MNELEALKYIFRNQMVITDDLIVIKYHNISYRIDKYSLKIEDPKQEYIDVFDYILKDSKNFSECKTTQTTEILSTSEDVKKITEEEFFRWKISQVKEIEINDKKTGKEIWVENLAKNAPE